jgi:uncharacterized membrane protein YukC
MTVVNVSLLALWGLCFVFLPELTYRTQSRFVAIPRETWNVVMYSFLGLYKIVVLVFVVIPYVSLLIMA